MPVYGEAQWKARFKKVNTEIGAQQDLNIETLRRFRRLRDSGSKDFKQSEVDEYLKWQAGWDDFVVEWNKFVTETGSVWAWDSNDDMLRSYEKRCYELRLSYEKLSGVVRSGVPIAPPPEASSGRGAFDWLHEVKEIVQWTAVGVGVFYAGSIVRSFVKK